MVSCLFRFVFCTVWSLSFVVQASDCGKILEELAAVAKQTSITIAVDYDSTVVDTDSFLTQLIFPQAIASILPLVPAHHRGAFTDFLAHVEENGPKGMPLSYDEAEWHESNWPFPIGLLPESLKGRPGLEPPISALVGFWDVLSEVFDRHAHHPVSVLPEFLEFFKLVNAELGDRVHWVVVTARFMEQTAVVPKTFGALGPLFHPLEVLHRGQKGEVAERAVPSFKAAQLLEFRERVGRPVPLFIDNDLRNLHSVRQSLGPNVRVLQMQRQPSGQVRLVNVP